MFPVSTPDDCMASSLMEYPRRFHGELMQVSWKFHVGNRCFLCLNVMVAWRLLTDAVFMEVPCRFHGELMQNFMQFPCALWRWCLYLHLLVLPCTLTDAGSMEVPCRFHAGSRELSWRLPTSKLNLQTQHVTNMKPAWKLHGKSMKPASVRVQDRTTRFQETVFPPFQK